MEDVLIQMFCKWIRKNNVPKELSREWVNDEEDEERMVIRFRYDNGKTRDFPYSEKRYNAIWEIFNDYWKSRNYFCDCLNSKSDSSFIQ